MIESPQSFIVSTECQKVAEQYGFRQNLGEIDGWAAFESTTAQGTIWLASKGDEGPWFLALNHLGVIEELAFDPFELPGPGKVRYAFYELRELYIIMPRVYGLATSLPNVPLKEFEAKIAGMPRSTEAERSVVQRIGQEIFRKKLLEYWGGACPLTGITDTALLRASHIKPWKDCDTDEERLDVHNGLLLSALWDAAFDRHLVSFDDNGQPTFSPNLSVQALGQLNWKNPIPLTDNHRKKLLIHRHACQY